MQPLQGLIWLLEGNVVLRQDARCAAAGNVFSNLRQYQSPAPIPNKTKLLHTHRPLDVM